MKLKHVSDRALNRFEIISRFRFLRGQGFSVSKVIEIVASEGFYDEKSQQQAKISSRTVYRWIKAFERGGVAQLNNQSRERGKNSTLGGKFIGFLQSEKKKDPFASIPELIKRARLKGIVGIHEKIARSTVNRYCRSSGLPISRQHSLRTEDMRRFAFPSRMQMILCDGKHFRAGPNSAKRVVMYFIDDATRMILSAVIGCSESTELFIRGFDLLVRRFGLPDGIYLDRGPGYISNDTALVLARLGVTLAQGRVRYPEGHGKIERFNQTVQNQLLRNLDKRIDIDPDHKSLEMRMTHFAFEDYNHTVHESLDGKTPYERFYNDARDLNFSFNDEQYRQSFIRSEDRKVSKDNIVRLGGEHYEMPKGHSNTYVRIIENLLSGQVYFCDLKTNTEHLLSPPDLHENALAKRSKIKVPEKIDTLPPSAAELHYLKTHGPVLDGEGNFFEEKV